MTDHPLSAARPLRRRSFLGLLGATPLAAGGLPAAPAPASATGGRGGGDSGQDRCGAPPADLLPGDAYDRYLTALAADGRAPATSSWRCVDPRRPRCLGAGLARRGDLRQS